MRVCRLVILLGIIVGFFAIALTADATPALSCPAGKYQVDKADKHVLWMQGYRYVKNGECLYHEEGDGASFFCEVKDRYNSNKRFEVTFTATGRINPGDPNHPPAGSPKSPPSGSPVDLWHYFSDVKTTIVGKGWYSGGLIQADDMGPFFQVGEGASIQNKGFGGAFWMAYDVIHQPTKCSKYDHKCFPFKDHGQGDINVVFEECPNPPVEVCDFETATVKEVLTSELDDLLQQGLVTKDLTQCDEIEICRDGETITIPKFEFREHDVVGECPNPPVEVCDFQTAAVQEILTSELDAYLGAGLGTLDLTQCDEVVICRKGETLTVPLFEVTVDDVPGICPPPPEPPECPVTFEECVQECNESYDIFWANKCIAFCDRHCGIFCDEGDKDCIFDGLEPEVCAQANGFLGQLNILTVVNTSDAPLNAEVYYRNMQGEKAANVFVSLDPQDKRDVFVNELGLQGDTVGSVCVRTDAEEPGRWTGSVTMYKGFEDTIEFALRYPLENAKQGFQVLPLNTFKLGGSGTANWVRLFDAASDGAPLTGTLFFYNTAGELVQALDVLIPDGGRVDYPAHEYLGQDATGLALFAPGFDSNGDSQKFYYTAARYTYECANPILPFGCADFRTAFVTPSRVPVRGKIYNTLTRQNSTTVAEVFNVMDKDISVIVTGFNAAGEVVLTKSGILPPFSNFNFIANEAVEDNQLAYVLVDSGEFYVTAVTSSYVPNTGDVNYGFSFPATRVPGATQHLEYNSFLGQINDLELVNTSDVAVEVSVVATDYLGNLVASETVNLAAGAMQRLTLSLPEDSYGTIVVDGEGILARSFVINPGQYVLPFIGR